MKQKTIFIGKVCLWLKEPLTDGLNLNMLDLE